MPLLGSIVRVEMTSLEDQDESPSSLANKRARKVHFSGFDCSSTKPPVDAKVGSHSHHEDCISALILAAHQLKALTDAARSNSENHDSLQRIVCALKSITSFLKQLAQSTDILRECAKVGTKNDLGEVPLLSLSLFAHFHLLISSFHHCSLFLTVTLPDVWQKRLTCILMIS